MPLLKERPERPERSPIRSFRDRLAPGENGDDHLLEYGVILVLVFVVTVIALVFLGDAVAELVSLIGGRVG